MIDYFDTPDSMSPEKVREECEWIMGDSGGDTDLVLDYLAELASAVYSCPDKCDEWACKFFDEIEKDLYGY